jgi:hypothetical protein
VRPWRRATGGGRDEATLMVARYDEVGRFEHRSDVTN